MMKNDYVDGMFKKLQLDVVVSQQVIFDNNKYSNTLFYLVEGEDYDYYNYKISSMFPSGKIRHYICEGKKNVISARNLIMDKYQNKNSNVLCFFVDRDYDFDKVPKDVYKTEFYSIENYYVSRKIIRNVIINMLKVDKQSSNFDRAMNLLNETYSKYSKFAKHMNIFFYTIREIEKTQKCGHANFKKYKLGYFIKKGELDNLTFDIYSYDELLNKYDIGYNVDEVLFKRNSTLFRENCHYNFRGKFELEYLKWFLRKLRSSIENGKCGFKKSDTCNYDFCIDTMLILSSYAYYPEALSLYINSRIRSGVSSSRKTRVKNT